jgi:hypothetical protein
MTTFTIPTKSCDYSIQNSHCVRFRSQPLWAMTQYFNAMPSPTPLVSKASRHMPSQALAAEAALRD